MCSEASSSTALRTVPWLTRKRAANSISDGIASPGFHSPETRLCVSRILICSYSGRKEGVAAFFMEEHPSTARSVPRQSYIRYKFRRRQDNNFPHEINGPRMNPYYRPRRSMLYVPGCNMRYLN